TRPAAGTISAGGAPDAAVVHAEIVASGIPGAGAITQVGTFQHGGPLRDNVALINHSTDPGGILDRGRLLVASTSNFDAPKAFVSDPEGSVLSIDVRGEAIAVPPHFAAAGGQATALGGAVIVYAAQNGAFLNSVN